MLYGLGYIVRRVASKHPCHANSADNGVVIVETKGQEDLDVPLKMHRLKQWCEDINRVQTDVVYDFMYVDEKSFKAYTAKSFSDLLASFREYKED